MNEVVESPFAARTAVAPHDSAGSRQNQSRELAETQTKYLMAERFPRDEVAAMDRILNAFSRRTLAEKAQYQFARGGSDIAGPSIRAAEAIAQQWGNMDSGWRELQRGTDPTGVPFSEVEAFCIDLQGRNSKRLQFIVRHWRDTKQGGYKLKDERDIYELCANQAQRRLRACILASVPGDVTEAAMQQAEVTLKANADTSAEAMHKMVEAFAPYGVTKEHIEKRIQRRLDAIQPGQVVSLKRIYASLRDDMSTPGEWFDMGEAPPPADAAGSIDAVRAAAAAKKGKPPASKPATGPVTMDPPTFDVPTTLAKIKAATDRETLALMADEFRDMADGADKTALLDAYATRDAELAEKA
jgi:hypothetical protein